MSAGLGEARVPHRSRVARPAPPRRVSGPARPARKPGPRSAPPRTSGAVRAQAAALPAPGIPALAPRVAEALRRLPDARWLDRLLRGQAWVAIIGVALIGIVAMQVSLLKMNAGIGQAVEKTSTLERQNADLRASVSQLSSEERIQREAMQMGLVMPAAGDVRYLRARPNEDARKAARSMRAPDALAGDAIAAAGVTTAVTADPAAATTVDPAAATAAPATTTDPAAATTATDPAATTTTTDPAATTTAPSTVVTADPATGATAAPVGAGTTTP